MTFYITIPIIPKAQKRDRIAVVGGHTRSYKDKKQRLAEDTILTFLMASKPLQPLQGPISLEVRVYVPIPKSKPRIWREKAQEEYNGIRPITRPDVDNYAKQILDVMTGIYFKDDRQVTDLAVSKRYTTRSCPLPCWVVTMRGDY